MDSVWITAQSHLSRDGWCFAPRIISTQEVLGLEGPVEARVKDLVSTRTLPRPRR